MGVSDIEIHQSLYDQDIDAFLSELNASKVQTIVVVGHVPFMAAAEFLSTSPEVASVRYPSLPGDDSYELARKYLPKGSCGVVSFELAGGRAAAEKFMST